MYKNSKDIVKLLKHWKFSDKGFASKGDFKQEVRRKLGGEVEEKELDDLLRKHCSDNDHIDTQGLLSLLIGKTEGIPIDTLNLPISHDNPFRERQVDKLKENLANFQSLPFKTDLTDQSINRLMSKFNTAVSRMKQRTDGVITKGKPEFFEEIQKSSHFNEYETQLLGQIER
jgi:hypothetical protein